MSDGEGWRERALAAESRVTALETRQQELLATIVRLTNEVPFAEEVTGWIEQRAKMVAEVGTYRAKAAETMRCANALRAQVKRLEADLDAAIGRLAVGR